jgi:iron complex transport system substrate-binding protein
MNRRHLLFPLALLLACCNKSTPPVSSTVPASDPAPPATLAAGPRIVSTVPAATLNLVLIGGASHLVGVSKYDRLYLPESQKNLPVVGDYQTMNYEQLVKLKPTVLIIQTLDSRIEPKLREVAAAQHFDLLNMHFENVGDIWSSVLALGKAADMEPQAQLAIDAAKSDLKDIAAQYKDAPHPRVVYLVSASPLEPGGAHSFVDEMITAAGGTNVGAVVGDGYPDISRETLIKLAPDMLLIASPDQPEAIANDPRLTPWQSLPIPAATRKRIYLVTDGNSLIPSIDIAKNVRALAQLIHKDDPAAAPAPAGGKP